MKPILSLEEVQEKDQHSIGGKAYALWRLAKGGFSIPETVCVTTFAYREFLQKTGLRERIMLELHRKAFKEMRWEEIWDCATRIRNLFLTQPSPADQIEHFRHYLLSRFQDRPVAVRSSAPDEDDARSSFAGLHASYVNLKGVDSIIKHIRLVWASLWSDAALLYRQEIGLDVENSAMAVVVQETIAGGRSGVVFTRNPNDPQQAVIEAVHGLNQGLVDGDIEPDRWLIDRDAGTVVTHTQPERKYWLVAAPSGVLRGLLPDERAARPPLDEQEVKAVLATAVKAEHYFAAPQDVEWTFQDRQLIVLQSRPITTLAGGDPEDRRGWYLSLHRSFDNLKQLRQKIEKELIPAMQATAAKLGQMDLGGLQDEALAEEIKSRWEINDNWVKVYWADFIPYAHGVRLFGQFYNDAVQPRDPYEFIDLLADTDMASLARNDMLLEMAAVIRKDTGLRKHLERAAVEDIDPDFMARVEAFIALYGDLSCAVTGGRDCVLGTTPLFNLLLALADHPPANRAAKSDRIKRLEQAYLDLFDGEQRIRARELLDLARSSYRLRDDDNIHLGRIEAQLLAAVQEAKHRLKQRSSSPLQAVLAKIDFKEGSAVQSSPGPRSATVRFQARQLTGQPSGPGIAKGRARVIRQHSQLTDFKSGEILVCDAVDPNMTFVVPLAAAVVERRGGMLIHGAIIAREYGLPCITGVPDATQLIQTGDDITVDGYLGIVTIGETAAFSENKEHLSPKQERPIPPERP